jgi:TRAP-type C4-dicarboxylate transport system permease small subunit
MTEAAAGWLCRLNGRVSTWLARAAAFVLAVLAVMTFCDVIGRYFLNAPFSFSVEMTELSMGLVVYLAIGLTTHENGHVSVDFVTSRLPDRVRAAVEFLTGLAALACASR